MRVALPRSLCAPRTPVPVHLIGCGGSGSLMLLRLARMDRALRAVGHAGLRIVVYDPDVVSDANVGRQAFYPSDVGSNKAEVLVFRLNAYLGTSYEARATTFHDVADRYAASFVAVSCVDTARARRDIGAVFEKKHVESILWLDLGNDLQQGQAVLGQPLGHGERNWRYRLPTVLELFPALADPKLLEDDAPSCSLAEAIERQDLFINELLVGAAANLLWQGLRVGELKFSALFVNARSHQMTALPIDPDRWRRFGHRMGRCVPRTLVSRN